jgi:hypothetical protein
MCHHCQRRFFYPESLKQHILTHDEVVSISPNSKVIEKTKRQKSDAEKNTAP